MEGKIIPETKHKFIRRAIQRVLLVSKPKTRARISAFGIRIDRVFDSFRKENNNTNSKKLILSKKYKLSTVKINDREFPYIKESTMRKRNLEASGLHYKRNRSYKLWHTPEGQFELMQKIRVVDKAVIAEPIALVVGEGNRVVGYLLEKVHGDSLGSLIENGKLTPAETIKIERKLRTMIRKMHRHGIGHGDLNKGNIIINKGLKIKLIDPLDGRRHELNIRDDITWLEYLKNELDNYRRKQKM